MQKPKFTESQIMGGRFKTEILPDSNSIYQPGAAVPRSAGDGSHPEWHGIARQRAGYISGQALMTLDANTPNTTVC